MFNSYVTNYQRVMEFNGNSWQFYGILWGCQQQSHGDRWFPITSCGLDGSLSTFAGKSMNIIESIHGFVWKWGSSKFTGKPSLSLEKYHSKCIMWLKQFHKPSPSRHHFYRWDWNNSQSWVVNMTLFYPHYHIFRHMSPSSCDWDISWVATR